MSAGGGPRSVRHDAFRPAIRAALRVLIFFVVFSLVWITCTDRILGWLVSDRELLLKLATAKGWVYVGLTSLALFWLTYASVLDAKPTDPVDLTLDASAPRGSWRWMPLALFGLSAVLVVWMGLHAHHLQELAVSQPELGSAPRSMPLSRSAWISAALGGLFLYLAMTLLIALRRADRRWIGLAQQAMARKQAALALQLEILGSSINDIALLLDQTGYLVWANDRAHETYGYSPAVLRTLTIRDLVAPECTMPAPRDLASASAQAMRFETVHVRKDGSRFPVEASSRCFELDGTPYMQSVVRDISERRRSEQALRETATFLQTAQRAGQVGIYAWDMVRDELVSSPEFDEIFGSGASREATKTWRHLIAPEWWGRVEARLQEALEARGAFDSDCMIVNARSGQRRWVHWRGEIEWDAEGHPARMTGVVQDITERKEAEEVLREREEELRALVENTRDGIFRLDRQGRFLYANPAVAGFFGLAQSAFIGSGYRDLDFPESLCQKIGSVMDAVFTGGQSRQIEFEMGEGQSARFFLFRFSPEFGKDGDVASLLGIGQDLTEFRQAQRRYQTLFERMLDGLAIHEIVCDADGRPVDYVFLAVNPAFEALTGLRAQDVIGRNAREVIPNLPDARISAFGRVALFGETAQFESVLAPPGKHFQVTAFRPQPGQFACIVTDMTERLRAEQAFRESSQFNQQVIRSAQEGILVCDSDGRLQVFNPFLADLTGFAEEEIKGRFIWDVFPLLLENGWMDRFHRVLQGEPSREEPQLYVWSQTGRQAWFATVLAPYRSVDGRILGVIETIFDATSQVEARDQIRRMNEELELRVQQRTAQLEMANRELEAFSYSVSHDLRAPLRGITGFSSALQEDYQANLDETARHYLDRIREGAARMAQLIDDLLRLSWVGRTELDRHETNLDVLARRVLDELAQRAPERRVQLEIQEGLIAHADPRLIQVVLENLLGNAWKFTARVPQPRIVFGADRGEDGSTVFFVKDNGAGFDMQYVHKLFGAFQRLHRAEEFEGTGIGLAIVQRIISRHGGRVWAEAAPGEGATFFFTLPD